jgi:diguanylate cyclase (GGDEF)-like protein
MNRRVEIIELPENCDSGEISRTLKLITERSTGAFDINSSRFGKPKVLLACRDKGTRKWGQRWLQQAGFEVELAPEGQDVLAFAREKEPDIIFVESWLKTESGVSLLSQLQGSSEHGAEVFALCTSARQISDALDADVFDIARKPFDWQLLSRRAKKIIAQRLRDLEVAETRETLTSALEVANRARAQLRMSETVEPVTGLPNRTKFVELTKRGINAAHDGDNCLAVFVVGFDRLRLVFEALGRQEANMVMNEIAERLNRCVRRAIDSDTQLTGLRTAAIASFDMGRFGLMLTCSPEKVAAESLRREINEELSKPATIAGQTIYLPTSAGAAFYPEDAQDTDALILRAESAMRDAATAGAAFRFFSGDTGGMASRRLEIEQKLHDAFENNELRLAYQPLIDVTNGAVTGAEALLRWPQPDGGFIGPDEFVPIAEDSGLIIPIGEWVIDTACAQIREWHYKGLPLRRVAVNVAKSQLLTENFQSVVADCLDRHGLNPSVLELELSERGVLSGNQNILSLLRDLKSQGVSLSIDDFGTGDSAIAYLKELPVNTLKIDRSYMAGLANDKKSIDIAAAIIAMGQKLEMTIIAEGVETEAQLAILQALGCNEYQGFLCSPAVAPENIEALFEKFNCSL